MKIAIICPIPHLNDFNLGSFHLIIAQYLKDNKYASFYNKNGYVIVDNGVFETGKPLTAKRLLQLCLQIGAQEIVLPDFFFDAKKTLHVVESFLDKFGVRPNGVKLCAVIQGDCFKTFYDCYLRLCDLPIDVIGVPKTIIFADRISVLSEIQKELDLRKEYHCLGIKHVNELEHLSKLNFIRSCDTSLWFTSSFVGVNLMQQKGTVFARPDNFFYCKLPANRIQLAKENIEFLRRIANATENLHS